MLTGSLRPAMLQPGPLQYFPQPCRSSLTELPEGPAVRACRGTRERALIRTQPGQEGMLQRGGHDYESELLLSVTSVWETELLLRDLETRTYYAPGIPLGFEHPFSNSIISITCNSQVSIPQWTII